MTPPAVNCILVLFSGRSTAELCNDALLGALSCLGAVQLPPSTFSRFLLTRRWEHWHALHFVGETKLGTAQ